MLSCSCEWDADPEFGEWHYVFADKDLDFTPLQTPRRKRCVSCGELINIGALCVQYKRERYPYNEIEARIIGMDEDLNCEPSIRIADHHHCEGCGETYLNLTALGYDCLLPNEDMRQALKEYHEISGWRKTG